MCNSHIPQLFHFVYNPSEPAAATFLPFHLHFTFTAIAIVDIDAQAPLDIASFESGSLVR